MLPRFLTSAAASASFILALVLAAGPAARGQAVPKTKAAAKAKVDLNKATAEELEEHLPGVGAVTAKKIVAGRPYATVEDLSQAGVPARTIEAIRGLVIVTPARAVEKATSKAAATGRPGALVHLNSAGVAELETLPGIGPAHAREIIAHRPYKSVDDLARVKGLGQARIEAIRSLVTAAEPTPTPTPSAATTKPAPARGFEKAAMKPAATRPAARPATGRKVNLNTASKDELDALPGIGPVKAQGIIDARPFKSIEDIKRVKGIKDVEFGKISEMITVN